MYLAVVLPAAADLGEVWIHSQATENLNIEDSEDKEEGEKRRKNETERRRRRRRRRKVNETWKELFPSS